MSEDPSWRRNCQMVTRSLQSLQKKIGVIRRSTKKLLTFADINKEREKIRETTRSANTEDVTAIQEALQMMERFMKIHPCYSMEGVKLMGEARQALNEYQTSCDAFYKQCMAVEEHSRNGRRQQQENRYALANEDEEEDFDEEPNEAQSLLGRQHASQRAQYEQELHNEIVAEVERETHEIAENLRDVNIIFNHITKLVEEQGGQLNEIDQNLSAAARSTRNGTEQLRRAEQHQNSSTRTKWMVIILLILISLVTLHILAN